MDPEQQDWAKPADWDEGLLLGAMSDDMSDLDEAADAAACYPVPDMTGSSSSSNSRSSTCSSSCQ